MVRFGFVRFIIFKIGIAINVVEQVDKLLNDLLDDFPKCRILHIRGLMYQTHQEDTGAFTHLSGGE